jgi:hypothetical protein
VPETYPQRRLLGPSVVAWRSLTSLSHTKSSVLIRGQITVPTRQDNEMISRTNREKSYGYTDKTLEFSLGALVKRKLDKAPQWTQGGACPF